jgi:hypothetical protein
MSIVLLGVLGWAALLLAVVSVCTVAGRADRLTERELALSPMQLVPDVSGDYGSLPDAAHAVALGGAPRQRGEQHDARPVAARGR